MANLDQAAISAAQNSLIAYSIGQWPQFQAAPHHRMIASALERVAAGTCKRLMVFMPPRHGKSMLCSQFFPAWYLGKNPDKYIIAATYSQDLADDFGRTVRNQLASEEFRTIFPASALRPDSTSSKRFHTASGGVYFAVGAGGPLTGRGAHILLIDDLIKGREEADSEVQRRKLKDWYQSIAYTRLMPGGAVVVIQTRWHDDDLAGWLLEAHSHENWEVLNLPAINDNGQALWPAHYPIDTLEHIRETIGQRDWNALYQQNPIPDTGDYFKREWFQWYDAPPRNMTIYGASDYAVTEGFGDSTEHGVFGIDHTGDVYVLDWWTGKTASNVWIEYQLDLIRQYQPLMWIGESGSIRRAIEPFLMQRMTDRQDYCRLEWLSSVHDKPTRARSFQALASTRKVFLPAGKEWSARLLGQLLRFPAGAEDDAVDVCSLMGRALNMTYRPDNYDEDYDEPQYEEGRSVYGGY